MAFVATDRVCSPKCWTLDHCFHAFPSDSFENPVLLQLLMFFLFLTKILENSVRFRKFWYFNGSGEIKLLFQEKGEIGVPH